ncbi:inositol phosphorylceramide synthase [Spirosoma sp. KCTC 42546]|uniref:phosphatase PAP2 family protein n=1 Tax=Spirosoma sp. KCTC 42546 TaxID=2520506 RepID=UPI00115997B8|nr:phosphatase PAP2 family protein [Spirosoma sp. KCTC 42546]QDK83147.1 inositol phosphorylceramide synthase [Spirosoma sp. KCTC 42546]
MTPTSSITSPSRYKQILTLSIVSLGYLLLSFILVGFKSDQLVLVGLVNALFFASDQSRKFLIGFSIFIVYWIIFDYMKAFPNYQYNDVHIKSLYLLEKSLFGIPVDSSVLTPNEYWLAHRTTFFNVLTGLFYVSWIPVPLLFATYLFIKNRPAFFPLALTFVLVNLLGFIIYYLYPAAPPWYVQLYGFTFHPHTPGNTAGLANFDQYFGISLFSGIYAKSSNVFAAMPSLHSSYPVIVLYYGIKNKLGLVNLFFAVVMVGIWFSAVYTSHHYVLDVMAGITCAVIGITLFNQVYKTRWLTGFIQRMTALTA